MAQIYVADRIASYNMLTLLSRGLGHLVQSLNYAKFKNTRFTWLS